MLSFFRCNSNVSTSSLRSLSRSYLCRHREMPFTLLGLGLRLFCTLDRENSAHFEVSSITCFPSGIADVCKAGRESDAYDIKLPVKMGFNIFIGFGTFCA